MLYSVNSPYYRQFLSSTTNKYTNHHSGNTKRTSKSREPQLEPPSKEVMSTPAVSEYEQLIVTLHNNSTIYHHSQNISVIVHLALPPPKSSIVLMSECTIFPILFFCSSVSTDSARLLITTRGPSFPFNMIAFPAKFATCS